MASSSPLTKNLLAVAFGRALQRHRDIRGASSGDVADAMDIGHGYYRLIESGAGNLHANKSVVLTRAFEDTVRLPAVATILGYISATEMRVKQLQAEGHSYADGLLKAVSELAPLDARMETLVRRTGLLRIIDSSRSEEEAESMLMAAGAAEEVLHYLTEFETYGRSMSERNDRHIRSFFQDLPTLYFRHLYAVKESLLRLPVRVGFQSLWQWEAQNQDAFKEMICITRSPESVASKENLRRYRYRYLWNQAFQSVRFVFLSDRPGEEIKSRFEEMLLGILQSNRLRNAEYLHGFDAAMEKVQAKSLSGTESPDHALHSTVRSLLTGPHQEDFEDADAYEENVGAPDKVYDACWVFTLNDGISVGFLAEINDSLGEQAGSYKLVEGLSLTPIQTGERWEAMNDLWSSSHGL